MNQSNMAIYSATYKNASCKIAEKLGGVAVKRKNFLVEAMHEAGIHMDSAKKKEIPEIMTYEIRRSS